MTGKKITIYFLLFGIYPAIQLVNIFIRFEYSSKVSTILRPPAF